MDTTNTTIANINDNSVDNHQYEQEKFQEFIKEFGIKVMDTFLSYFKLLNAKAFMNHYYQFLMDFDKKYFDGKTAGYMATSMIEFRDRKSVV